MDSIVRTMVKVKASDDDDDNKIGNPVVVYVPLSTFLY